MYSVCVCVCVFMYASACVLYVYVLSVVCVHVADFGVCVLIYANLTLYPFVSQIYPNSAKKAYMGTKIEAQPKPATF